MRYFLALPVCLLGLTLSCLNAGRDRAERDLEVGKAERTGANILVHEGLAAIRRFSANEISLWAGAPSFTLELSADSPGTWTVHIENTLADAELLAQRDDTQPVTITALPNPTVTEKHYTLELPPGKTTLTLAPPDANSTEPFRFAVFADVQEKLNQVQDIYHRMNSHPGIRFALISGDLTSMGTREQLEQFQREMKTLQIPCYATLGNHELGTSPELYHEYFGRGNYRFVYRSVQFSMIDSASASIAPLAHTWLDEWLEEGKDRIHFVTMHIPLLDPAGLRSGGLANRGEANMVLKKLGDARVDTCFYGHIHSFYTFEHAGIPAYISGGGGAIPERLDGVGRHFLSVDVVPNQRIDQIAVVRVD